MDQTAHVVGEVLQPYPSLCPRQTLRIPPMSTCSTRARTRTGLVALLLALAQRLVAAGFAMDPAPQQRRLDLRAIGCPPIRPRPCCPHPGYRREPYCRASPRRSPDSAAPACADGDMVRRSSCRASWSTAPRLLLAPLCRLILPAFRRLARLYRAFSLRLLRCLGTATIEASMIWPPIARSLILQVAIERLE